MEENEMEENGMEENGMDENVGGGVRYIKQRRYKTFTRDADWPKHPFRRFFTIHCVPFACTLKAHVHPKDIARLCCCFEIVPTFCLGNFRIFRLCNIHCMSL